MFCVLNIEKRPNTLREKLFGGFIKDEYNAKLVPVFKAAPFYIFNVKVGKNGVDWDKIIYIAGKCSRRLVITENTPFPDRPDMSLFESDLLYREIMCNTFVEILKKLDSQKSITVIDSDAKRDKLLYKLSPFASTLTVVTDYKEKYNRVCDNIQQNSGLCATLQSTPSESQIKIDVNRSIMTITDEKNCINITDGSDFTVPEIYEKLLPANTDKYTFYSALYELCGVFSLGECFFETITVNNEKISLFDLDIKGIF